MSNNVNTNNSNEDNNTYAVSQVVVSMGADDAGNDDDHHHGLDSKEVRVYSFSPDDAGFFQEMKMGHYHYPMSSSILSLWKHYNNKIITMTLFMMASILIVQIGFLIMAPTSSSTGGGTTNNDLNSYYSNPRDMNHDPSSSWLRNPNKNNNNYYYDPYPNHDNNPNDKRKQKSNTIMYDYNPLYPPTTATGAFLPIEERTVPNPRTEAKEDNTSMMVPKSNNNNNNNNKVKEELSMIEQVIDEETMDHGHESSRDKEETIIFIPNNDDPKLATEYNGKVNDPFNTDTDTNKFHPKNSNNDNVVIQSEDSESLNPITMDNNKQVYSDNIMEDDVNSYRKEEEEENDQN